MVRSPKDKMVSGGYEKLDLFIVCDLSVLRGILVVYPERESIFIAKMVQTPYSFLLSMFITQQLG